MRGSPQVCRVILEDALNRGSCLICGPEGPHDDCGLAATKPSVGCAVLCCLWQAIRGISARETRRECATETQGPRRILGFLCASQAVSTFAMACSSGGNGTCECSGTVGVWHGR